MEAPQDNFPAGNAALLITLLRVDVSHECLKVPDTPDTIVSNAGLVFLDSHGPASAPTPARPSQHDK